jgi:hypothetical protein
MGRELPQGAGVSSYQRATIVRSIVFLLVLVIFVGMLCASEGMCGGKNDAGTCIVCMLMTI